VKFCIKVILKTNALALMEVEIPRFLCGLKRTAGNSSNFRLRSGRQIGMFFFVIFDVVNINYF